MFFLFLPSDEASSPLQPRDGQPRFYVKPVTAYGEGIVGQEGSRLSDQGKSFVKQFLMMSTLILGSLVRMDTLRAEATFSLCELSCEK